MIKRSSGPRPHLVDQGANPLEARVVVGLAEVDGAADARVHLGAAQVLGRGLLSDGRLHERGASQKKPAALGHQHVVAHHRQVRAARHAHAHDRRDLRDPQGAHDGVVAEDAPEIVGVREHVFLERQENAGRVHEVNGRNAVVERDVLRPDYFLRRHGKEGARLHRGVVGDDHHQTAVNPTQARDGPRRGRAAPLLVHLVRGVETEFKELAPGVDQPGDALARRQASFLVLRLDGLGPAALTNPLFLVLDFGQEVHHAAGVFRKVLRLVIDEGLKHRVRHVGASLLQVLEKGICGSQTTGLSRARTWARCCSAGRSLPWKGPAPAARRS